MHPRHFNPRSPHGERPNSNSRHPNGRHFNPRSPHGERHYLNSLIVGSNAISIHAPRTGSDSTWGRGPSDSTSFQSTLPARGATQSALFSRRILSNFNPRSPHGERPFSTKYERPNNDFNPRSPHGERPLSDSSWACAGDFNPRSPHGERPDWKKLCAKEAVFQSTLPARGATANSTQQHHM